MKMRPLNLISTTTRWGCLCALLSAASCGTNPSCNNNGSPLPFPTGDGAVPGDVTLLNEVLFHPADGAAPFVELKIGNAGPVLSTLKLVNQDAAEFPLPAALTASNPGSLVLILFDGQTDATEGVAHSDQTQFLNPAKGRIDLVDTDGNILDRITWDPADPDSAPLDAGGILPDVDSGYVLARHPKSIAPDTANDWTLLDTDFQSPGQPNPNPSITALLPFNGSTLAAGDVELNWYPVRGAKAYHVQLATDPDFTNLLVDTTIDVGPIIQTLAPGIYHWRLRAMNADGTFSDFTDSNTFEIVADLGLADIAEAGEPDDTTKAIVANAATAPGLRLSGVPLYKQRKDTHLLLLESDKDTDDPQAFNKPHPLGPLKQTDLADFYNCGFACVSMANGYYARVNNINRPNLSQDRISHEIYKDPAVFGAYKGPEWDFNYGYGFPWASLRKGISFALNINAPEGIPIGALDRTGLIDDFWLAVTAAITNKNPTIITIRQPHGGSHALLVVGWTLRAGARTLIVHDPGTTRVVLHNLDQTLILYYWKMSGVNRANVKKDEDSIWNDIDGDGVYDFDEDTRFHTDKNDIDTDGDCISDFVEIRRSVLDKEHGWGTYFSAKKRNAYPESNGKARPDTDGDGNAGEKDIDSDGGGLPDSVEDQDYNLDVDKTAGESNPFDKADDYRKITGKYQIIHNIVTNTSAVPNYAYNETGLDKRVTADFTLEVKNDGQTPKLMGTADCKSTKTFYYIHRTLIPPCDASRRDGYGPERTWTTVLDGQFTCYPGPTGSPHKVQFFTTANPDGKQVPDSDIYLPSCPPGDPLIVPTLGIDMPGINATYKPIKGLMHMESSPNTLFPNETGQRQVILECTIQRPS
ncbi:MAG: hypothetical protein HZA51_16575 [Planctomycetes bacterium]|nr:hypothetical protein [Planctomycetota bacterium]